MRPFPKKYAPPVPDWKRPDRREGTERVSRFVERVYSVREFRDALNLPGDEVIINVHVGAFEVKIVTKRKSDGAG